MTKAIVVYIILITEKPLLSLIRAVVDHLNIPVGFFISLFAFDNINIVFAKVLEL